MWRSLGSLAWRNGGFRLLYKAEYFSSILDSRARLPEFEEVRERIPDAETPLFLRYPSVWEHSICVRYEFPGKPQLRLFGGIHTLFNEISPFAPAGDVETGRRANFTHNHHLRGQRFYLGAA